MVERKQQPAAGAGLGAEQRFDVVLSARPDITPDEVRRRVENSFVMPMDKAEAMLKALETRDFIRVGQDVLRVRAEKAQRDLEGVGFKVELRSTLSLAPIDPRITCPHCGVRVAIGEDRLCPQCGENVSRPAPVKTLQTRIEAEERERIERQINRETQTTERSNQRELEEALRRRIRQDLEKEYGLDQSWRRKVMGMRPWAVGGVLTLLCFGSGVVGSFLLKTAAEQGWMTGQNGPFTVSKFAAKDQQLNAALDLLASRSAGFALPVGGQSTQAGAAEASAADRGTGSGAPVLASPEASLAQWTAQQRSRPGAVAINAVLSQSPWPDRPRPPGVFPPPPPPLSDAARAQLLDEFARQAAAQGQISRAREILAAGASPISASTEVLIQAWALAQPDAAFNRERMEALRQQAIALPEPQQQVQALAGAATAFAQAGHLPPALAQSFLETAGQALRSMGDAGQRGQSLQTWSEAMGDVLHAQFALQLSKGDLANARAQIQAMDDLRKQLPAGPGFAHLAGLQYRSLMQLNQEAEARRAMADSVARSKSLYGVVAQAEFFQQIGRACGAAVPAELFTPANALAGELNKTVAADQARAFLLLARLAVLAGRAEEAGRWQQAAQQSPPATAAERVDLQAGWLVHEQLDAAARAYHLGQAGTAEEHVRRAALLLM